MSLSAEVLDAMIASGCTAEQIVAAVKASDIGTTERVAAKREHDRQRKREQRAAEKAAISTDASAMSHGQIGTATDDADNPSPDKEIPHTPLETNPNQVPPFPPKGGVSPRGDTDAAIQAYSEMATAAGLAVPRAVTAGRRARLKATLRDHGMAAWREAVAKVGASDFCRGSNERGWKADLDFLLQAKTFPKILEGAYDNRARSSPVTFIKDTPANAARRRLEQYENARRNRSEIDDNQPIAGLLPSYAERTG